MREPRGCPARSVESGHISSVGVKLAARTCTSASPMAGCGSGASSKNRPSIPSRPSGFSMRTAFMGTSFDRFGAIGAAATKQRPTDIGGSRAAGDTDHVAFGVGEVPDDEVVARIRLGSDDALPAELLHRPERRLDALDPDVEDRMTRVAVPSADAAADARPVARAVPIHEPVV